MTQVTGPSKYPRSTVLAMPKAKCPSLTQEISEIQPKEQGENWYN